MAVNEVSAISKWEPGQKYCLRVATFECHYLIQTNNAYLRDQWLHSIIWKVSLQLSLTALHAGQLFQPGCNVYRNTSSNLNDF